jgi:hypothetical protein
MLLVSSPRFLLMTAKPTILAVVSVPLLAAHSAMDAQTFCEPLAPRKVLSTTPFSKGDKLLKSYSQ